MPEPKLSPLCYGGCWWHFILLRHCPVFTSPSLPFLFPSFIFSNSTASTFFFPISFQSYSLPVGWAAKYLKLRPQTINVGYLSFCGSGLGCGFSGCCWLNIAHEVASTGAEAGAGASPDKAEVEGLLQTDSDGPWRAELFTD